MTNTVSFHTTVVFQHQQAFHFQVPHWVEQRRCSATHAALRAGFHRGLEVLVERNTAGVERFTATDRAAQRTNTAGIDADTGTLRNVFHDRAGGGVDRVQAVAALDQHARAELAGWGTHAGHNRRRQRNFEGRDRIVETLHVIQTGITRVAGEQAGSNQDIQELGALVDFTADAVLHQIFPFQLLYCGIGEVHITPVVDKAVHLLELFGAVVFQQVAVIFAHIDHTLHLIVQLRRLKLAVGFFTQVEDRQACSHVLVIRRVTGNQVSSGFDNGFVDIRGSDPFVKLDMRAEFYL